MVATCPSPSSLLRALESLVATYLPVSPCGLPVDLGVVGQVPVPVDGVGAVAGRPPRQLAQARDRKQAREAAAGVYLPVLVVRLAGGRRLDRVGAGWVLGRAQDGGHVERPYLAAMVVLGRCR